MSLIAFLRILVELETNEDVLYYNRYDRLLKGIKDYKCQIGFGLHAGWAIEGAIGSHLKIDMSYLSLHVNMSMVMEELTK